MTDLTDRQRKLLRSIVERYIDTAEPVGSESIEKIAGLGVSPATIRNEMATLTKAGYLVQPHTSAGRIPTSLAIKLYINQLMEEKNLSVRDEVSIKESLWDQRFEYDKLMRQATRALAAQTNTLALATSATGDVYAAGMSNILDKPEFYDIDLTKAVLSLIDRYELLNDVFGRTYGDELVHVVFGDELALSEFAPCGFAFTKYSSGQGREGYIGVVGPCRLPYQTIIPTLRYFGSLLNEVSRNW